MSNVFGKRPPKRFDNQKIVVNYKPVPEGHHFDFKADKINFAFCDKLCGLYKNEDGVEVEFEDFFQPFINEDEDPKSGFPLFNYQLLDNLEEMDVKVMRPVQIAAMMATCFTPPVENSGLPDFICISTTGSGKTLAYLVPMIQKCIDRIKLNPSNETRPPMVLIFVHTFSLANNVFQTASLLTKNTDVKLRLITGSTPFMRDSNFDIGICTVGRFKNHLFDYEGNKYEKIDLTDLRYLVVDECDQMVSTSEFREIYEKLKENRDFVKLLFSATIDKSVFSLIDETNYYAFGGGEINHVAASVRTFFWQVNSHSTSRIFLHDGKVHVGLYTPDERRHPFDVLFHFLHHDIFDKPTNKEKVIVFLKRNSVANILAVRLNCYGINAFAVHGNQSPELRKKILQEFVDGKCKVLIASHMLTRGFDVDVNFIINYDLPLEYNDWVHRCGRTGRNGNRGVAITFVDLENPYDYPNHILRKIASNVVGSVPEFMEKLKSTKNED